MQASIWIQGLLWRAQGVLTTTQATRWTLVTLVFPISLYGSATHEWLHLNSFGAVHTAPVPLLRVLSEATRWHVQWHFLLFASFKVFYGQPQAFGDPVHVVPITLLCNDLALSFWIWDLVCLVCPQLLNPCNFCSLIAPLRVATHKTHTWSKLWGHYDY